jgi:hypothetical protein
VIGFMRKWHKYLGLATTALVLLVSVTGILLIHKKDLGLNRVTVNIPGYSKRVPPEGWHLATTAEGKTLLSTKLGVYLGGMEGWRRTLPVAAKKLYVEGNNVYACTTQGLQLSADGGESWRNVLHGEEAKALHLAPGRALAVTAKGIYQRRAAQGKWQLLALLPGQGIDVRELLPDGEGVLLAAKEGLYRVSDGKVKQVKLPVGENAATGVELQKVISDLHTGAFFGSWFMLVIDLVALSLVFFSISGVWLWYVPWKKRRRAAVFR